MSEEQKRKAPAFQFYADDFLAGTSDMSAEEVGGYIRLLCHQWTKGGIPNDPDRAGRMATLLGSPSLGYVLAKFSLCEDGMLRNERLEQVRAEQEAYKLKQASAGRNGAEKRWSKWPKDGNPNGNPNGVAIATPMATPMATAWPEDSSPSPTPNNKEESIASEPQRSRFAPPTIKEVEDRCLEIGLPTCEASKFVNYYESKGWIVGRSKMKSWKASLAGWKDRHNERQQALPIQSQSRQALDQNIANYL
jgi:uncharacterized protein YdaU (DUF1376 family)